MRLAKLWRASGPSNFVAAVLAEDDSVLTSQNEIGIELGAVWSRTFSKAGSPPQAFYFLDSLGVRWAMDCVHPPSIECIMDFLQKLKDSAPGPDCIPYSCYKVLLAFLQNNFLEPTSFCLLGACSGLGSIFKGPVLFLKIQLLRVSLLGPTNFVRSALQTPIPKPSQARMSAIQLSYLY